MTMAGKILTMGYALFYVPMFLYAMNIVLQANFQRIRREDDMIEEEIRHVEADVDAIIDNQYTMQDRVRKPSTKK